jgi:hypothetical protein
MEHQEHEMHTRPAHHIPSLPVANYSSAIAKAVEWLGDRYLLAKPIKAATSVEPQPSVHMTPGRRRRSTL